MKTKIKIVLLCAVFAFTAITNANAQRLRDLANRVQNVQNTVETARNTYDEFANSELGRAIMSAIEEITPEQEYYIGRAVAANILSRYRLDNSNAALTAYLNNICMAIVINSPRPDIFNGYHVAILNSTEVNAFATPGGHIFVTRGLINTARSEDALAAVIAHEVAHIQLQHGLKAIRSSRFAGAVAATGTAAVSSRVNLGELTAALNESVNEIVQTLVTNGYSQSQEYEADTTAMSLLAGAGYNPSALIEMLQALPTSGNAGFSRTHPQPAQRVTEAQKTVGRHRVTDTAASRRERFTAATR